MPLVHQKFNTLIYNFKPSKNYQWPQWKDNAYKCWWKEALKEAHFNLLSLENYLTNYLIWLSLWVITSKALYITCSKHIGHIFKNILKCASSLLKYRENTN